ncbi:MAG: hypothetical protein M1820_010524 [Bogoriella megaspora]|nr:MAG: hypothetical protein M1820_010524 [Bogoriella megaspora]
MSADREVKLLNWFIKKGTFTLAPAIVISAALFGVAAYLAPTSIVRQLTLSALAFNLLIPLYTVVFILPTRFELGRLEEAGVQAIEEKSERAKELVRKWNWYHDFRMVLEGFVWVAAVGALQLL